MTVPWPATNRVESTRTHPCDKSKRLRTSAFGDDPPRRLRLLGRGGRVQFYLVTDWRNYHIGLQSCDMRVYVEHETFSSTTGDRKRVTWDQLRMEKHVDRSITEPGLIYKKCYVCACITIL